MLGSHLSIAGGLVNALLEAQRLKMDCVQVFTRNQRQWKTPPIKPDERDEWLRQLKAMKWDYPPSRKSLRPARVVSHNSYLINLASPEGSDFRAKSIAAHRAEIERCEELHIPLAVTHPGAHLGTPSVKPGEPRDLDAEPTPDEFAGLKRIIDALDRIHADLPGYRTITAIETTVGSGTNLGYSFHHLAFIRENVREPDRIGFCLDTCHVTAAGYDMRTEKKAAAALKTFDQICGLRYLHAIHMNDSVGGVGSRKDRHAHIGEGTCGKSCFRAVLNHPTLHRVPHVLETPKGVDEKGVEWDLINIRRLKRLIRSPELSR